MIREHQNWKAAFTACVDIAPTTAEYKLLQLRQCLVGEALRLLKIWVIQQWPTRYIVKERLE